MPVADPRPRPPAAALRLLVARCAVLPRSWQVLDRIMSREDRAALPLSTLVTQAWDC
jgi:hypothetical protein